MKKAQIYWIAKTAVFIALLVSLQAVTKVTANQILTGSVVNLVLILSAIIGGLGSGITVSALSPVMAALLGIAPNWGLVPFIAVGNISIVLVWSIICLFIKRPPIAGYVASLVAGAFIKFGVLYFLVVKVAVPYVLKLPEQQAGVIAGQFGITQLFTAAIGGAVACIILPVLAGTIHRMEDRAGVGDHSHFHEHRHHR
jgi:hypothetical protein